MIKSIKDNKKEYFWSRSYLVLVEQVQKLLKNIFKDKEEKMKIVKKAYKFRIYPTLEQISFFAKSFGCVRKVHNLMLDDRKKDYEEYKSTGIKKN